MATGNTINVGLNVSSNGTTEAETKKALKLKQTLEGAQAAARIPMATQAAKQGVAAKAASVPSGGETKLSGSLGSRSTGSASSDFAAQAQGLGGLVHVYATFAANLFAVSAGFNALSHAMDVTNLVKGLDQIGASSGRNLGSLAKQMADVADGAISMRQAMTSTAMASSGGMSNVDILRMTQVAKNASLALGRDLPDSMERLTKGIVKTQPELLDELGIMTRMIPAQQAYARELGKSISSLTDFEKRQAFANAVLAEGEKKFGNIQLDANPYSKVLSSMQNLMQTGLELMNKVLGPLMSALASSPVGLATAMAAIAAVLLKQAIPAIGSYKESLRTATENAQKLANFKSAEAKRSLAESLKYTTIQSSENADLAVAKVEEAEKRIQSIKEKNASKNKSIINVLALTDPSKVDPKDLANIEKKALMYEKMGKLNVAATYRDIASSVVAWGVAEEKHNAVLKENMALVEKGQGLWTTAGQTRMAADNANRAAARAAIVSSTAEIASVHGIVAAYTDMNKQIAIQRAGPSSKKVTIDGKEIDVVTPKMTAMGAGITRVTSLLGAATSAAGTALNAFGVWGQVIGLVSAGLAILDGWLSSNAKQMDEYNSSLAIVADNTKFLSTVAATLWAQDSSQWLTAESVQARANAIESLSGSLNKALKTFKDAKIEAGWYDNVLNGISSFFGGGVEKNLAKALNRGIIDSLQLIEEGPIKDEYIAKLKDTYGIKEGELDLSTVTKISLSPEIMEKLVADQKNFSQALSSSAASGSAAKASFTSLGIALQTLQTSLISSDPITRYGLALIDTSTALKESFKDTGTAFQELLRLSNTPSSSSVLGKMGKDLAKDSEQLNEINNRYNAQVKAIKALTDAQNKARKAGATLGGAKLDLSKKWKQADVAYRTANKLPQVVQVVQSVPLINVAEIKAGKEMLLSIEKEKAVFTTKYASIVTETAIHGVDLIGKGFDTIIAEGAIKIQGALAAGISGTAGIQARADVELKGIAIRVQSNNIMLELIASNEKNVLANEAVALSSQKLALELQLQNKVISLSAYEKQSANLAKDIAVIDKSLAIISGKNAFKSYSTAAKSTDEVSLAAAAKVRGTSLSMAKLEADNSALGSTAEAVKINAVLDKISEKHREIIRQKTAAIALDEIDAKSLDNLNSISTSMYFQNMADAKVKGIGQQKLNILAQEEVSIKEKLAYSLSKTNNHKLQEQLREGSANDIKLLSDKVELQKKLNNESDNTRAIAAINKQLTVDELKLVENKTKKDLSLNRATALVDIRKSELEVLKGIEAIDQSSYESQKGILDQSALKLANDKSSIDIEKTRQSELLAAKAAFDSASTSPGLNEASKNELATQLLQKQNLINEAANTGLSISSAKFKSDSKILDINTQYLILQAKQAESMAKMVDVTSSLTTLFGEMGTNIGKVGEAILAMGASEDKLAIQKQSRLDDLSKNGPPDPAKTAKVEDEFSRKSAKLELTNISAVASASKKMFGEKTAAYKIMNGIEKAASAFKMAMQIQELAMDFKRFAIKIGLIQAEVPIVAGAEGAKTGLVLAGEAATMPAKIAGIYASFMSMLGPFGPPAAALAIAAFIGAFTSGRGGASVPSQQEVAQNNRNTGVGGVFGDATKTDTGIKSSLDLMAGAAKPQLENTSIMVKLLDSINNNTAGAINALISSGFTKATAAAGAARGYDNISGGISFTPTQTMVDASKDLIAKTFVIGSKEIDPGFFSRNYTKQFRDTLDPLDAVLARTLEGMFGSAVDLVELSGKALGISADKVSAALATKLNLTDIALTGTTAEQASQLSAAVGGRISAVIDNMMGDILDPFRIGSEESMLTANRLILGIDEAGNALNSLGIKAVNFKDVVNKQAEDIGAEITRTSILKAETATKSKTSTYKISSWFFGDRTFNVTTIEKVTSNIGKVVDILTGSSEEIASAYVNLKNMQTTLTTLGFSSEIVSLKLIKGAGSIDTLSSGVDSFTENFTTSAEKTAIKQAKLNIAFSNIGMTAPKTAQEFRKLVDGLKAGGEASAEQLGKVLVLSSNVADLTGNLEEASKALNAFDLASVKRSQEIELMTARGYAYNAMLMSRADKEKELLAKDPTGALVRGQRLIDIAQDKNKTDSLSLELLNAQGKTQDALNITRANELKVLSATDKLIKQEIYDTLDANKLREARSSQEVQIYNLLGLSEEALKITRAKELDVMDNLLKPTQLYIYALQDQATLKAKLKTAYDTENTTLKTTITNMQGFIKTLKETRDSMLLGELSTLTPAQKYSESKAQKEAIARAAVAIAVTDSEIATRNDAISKLPSVTGTFLEASKNLFASSEQYTSDFNSVLALLDSTSSSLLVQQTDAEKQLGILESSNTILDIIKDNTEGTATLLARYLEATSRVDSTKLGAITSGSVAANYSNTAIPGFANGGTASGIAIVGEKGPELVNFATPSTVYSNQASNDIFNTKELVQEIKNLRQEVAQLRSEQQEQTGHLISTNYDANTKAANKIAAATENAATLNNWKDRSKLKLA